MKNLKYIIIFALFLSACQSKEDKEFNKFISNFEKIELPYSYDAEENKKISDFKTIEKEIAILQDSANNAICNKESKIYYVGEIETEKDFNIIIVGEHISVDSDSYMLYNLYTITKKGKVISSIHFHEMRYDFNDLEYAKCNIDKNLDIQISRFGDVYDEADDVYTNIYKITENYKIAENGKIKLIKSDEFYAESNKIMEEDAIEFKQLNLPYTINNGQDGEQIKNKEQICDILLQDVLREEVENEIDGFELEHGMNVYTAIGTFMETDNFKAIVFQHYANSHGLYSGADEDEYMGASSMYMLSSSYYVATYNKDNILIDKQLIGTFRDESLGSADYKYVTDATIILNKDTTISLTQIATEYPPKFAIENGEKIEVEEITEQYQILEDGKISKIELVEIASINEKFEDVSPKTENGDFDDIIVEYHKIIDNENYTKENPGIDQDYTTVTLIRDNDDIKMIELYESDRNYENKFQYFYNNNKLFYVYISLEHSNEDSDDWTIEKHKFYFTDDKCVLHLFNNSEKENTEYKSSDVLEDAKKYLQKTLSNKWLDVSD